MKSLNPTPRQIGLELLIDNFKSLNKQRRQMSLPEFKKTQYLKYVDLKEWLNNYANNVYNRFDYYKLFMTYNNRKNG